MVIKGDFYREYFLYNGFENIRPLQYLDLDIDDQHIHDAETFGRYHRFDYSLTTLTTLSKYHHHRRQRTVLSNIVFFESSHHDNAILHLGVAFLAYNKFYIVVLFGPRHIVAGIGSIATTSTSMV